jgi:hypothetical protein
MEPPASQWKSVVSRNPRTFGLVASALTLVCCVACDSSEAASTLPAPLPCSAIIDSSDEIPDGFEATVLDSVSFPTYELPAGAGARRGAEGTDLEGLTFSKFGLVVRAEREVAVEVADDGGARVALDWPPTPAARVGGSLIVGPCRGSDSPQATDAEWVVFAGGVWVSKPACVTLRVTSGGDSAAHRLGIGTRCGS